MIPVIKVKDTEDQVPLVLVQEVVDEGQGVGVLLRLRMQITVVRDKHSLPSHLLQDDKAGEGPLARAWLNPPSLDEVLHDLDHGLLTLSLYLEIAVASGLVSVLQGYPGFPKRIPRWRVVAGLATKDVSVDLEDSIHLGRVLGVIRQLMLGLFGHVDHRFGHPVRRFWRP